MRVTAADFSDIMAQVVSNLEKAYYYAANDNERNMVKAYVEHFKYGEYFPFVNPYSIEKHKDS